MLAVAVLVVMLGAASTWVWARSGATTTPPARTAVLRVDTSRPGADFEVGAVGLSTEILELSRGRLSASHPRLVRLMRLLGPSVLRIGAGSVDLSWWTSSSGEPPPPWATSTITPANLRVLHGLLTATGWRVLLGVNFGHFEPARVANEARSAQEILGADLLGIEIGNEPNSYSAKVRKVILRPSTYGVEEYLGEAKAYSEALAAGAPGVAVYGPATSSIPWLTKMGAAARMFTELTPHYYPTSTCPQVPAGEPAPTAEGLLSLAVRKRENETLEALAGVSTVAGRPVRIGETNSVAYCSESTAAKPTLASALWALDWTLRAASSGIEGMNFYDGFGACGDGSKSQSPICATSPAAANLGHVNPQPEYYGLLAASRVAGGRFVPISLTASSPLPNIDDWATVTPGGTVKIAIENLAISGPSQPLLLATKGYAVTEQSLSGRSAYSRQEMTFAGASVTAAREWRPRAERLPQVHGDVRVVVRPASAVVLILRRNH